MPLHRCLQRLSAALLLTAVSTLSAATPDALGEPPLALLDGATQTLVDGRLVARPLAPDTEQVVLYFGASWCGPCRAFMPDLRAAYEHWQADNRNIELVFVSADGSCKAMESYVRQLRMPWPVVACRKRDRLPALKRLREEALPGLVVVDADGTVVDSSFWESQYGRYQRVLSAID